MTKVSVIIPVYGVEKYIEECLQSVFCQTLEDIQIIVINDKTYDNSWDIVKKLSAKQKNVFLIENEHNSGLAYTRNRGLAAAVGEYVYFLDSDDMITPNALEKLYNKSQREELDVQIFEADFIYETQQLEARFKNNPAIFKGDYPLPLTGKELFAKWMKAWDWMPSQPRFFYKREFLERNNLRFAAGKLHEDESFTLDVLMCAAKVGITKEKFFIRRFRESSIMTGTPQMASVESCIYILEHAAEYKRENYEDKALCEAMDFYYKKIYIDASRKLQRIPDAGSVKVIGNGKLPRVSVLIPAYNVEKYIDDSVMSVLNQTFDDWELIIVDDCSTDDTLRILREYEKKDARIHVFAHEVNCGQSCGRNTALAHAVGDYVYMLDADDCIKPELLEDMVKLFDRDKLDVAGFETSNFCDDAAFASNVAIKTVTYRDTPVMNGLEAMNYCVKEESLSSSTPTFFIRRDYLDKIGLRFMEGILHEDVGFILELIMKVDRVKFIPHVYFLRRIRANSTMTSGFTDKNIEGYLRSYYRSFDIEPTLRYKYSDDKLLSGTLGKWRRDMLYRLRQLYTVSEERIYSQKGGHIDDEIRKLFETVKLFSIGPAQAKDILGENEAEKLMRKKISEVYLLGQGSYAERTIHVMDALDIPVKGIIVPTKERNSSFGIKLYEPEEVKDRDTVVIYSVSHYYSDIYDALINDYGFTNVIRIDF